MVLLTLTVVFWLKLQLLRAICRFVLRCIGFAAGQHHGHTGGASNYLCLPNEPEYGEGNHQVGFFNPIRTVEYETLSGYRTFPAAAYNHDAPCARCYSPGRPAAIMLPAKTSCPDSWTMVSAIASIPSHIREALLASA